MTKDLGNLQPLTEEKFFEDFENLEEDARKERIQSVIKERNEILDSNRKLFSRAKEAEGFKQDEEGNWIKEVEKKSEAKKTGKSDEEVMKRLESMALKIANITADDEVELVNKWKERTGFSIDEIVGDGIFQEKLASLRTARANAEATANLSGKGEDSGAKGTPEYWIAKSTKDAEGNPLFPDDMPNDYKLRAAIVEKMMEQSKSGRRFYNQK